MKVPRPRRQIAQPGRHVNQPARDQVRAAVLGLPLPGDRQQARTQERRALALGSALRPVSEIGHPAKGAIWVKVNGQLKQQGDLSQQIWSVPEQIAYLSSLVTLQAGDLIFSGTPSGVGPVTKGDKLEGHVDGVGELTITYASER